MSKISPGTILLAFLAVLCGLLGVFLAVRPPKTASPRPAAAQAAVVTVPVASASLTEGRRITLGDIAILKLTREQMQKQNMTGSFMGNAQQIIGRVLRAPITAGRPFEPASLFPEGMGPGIEKELTTGHRAVTVAVGGNDALLGFATAGSWVDVIFRSEPDQTNTRDGSPRWTRLNTRQGGSPTPGRQVTITLIERVRVLAVDANTLNAAPDKAIRENVDDLVSVTLEVTPEQAEQLRVVDGRGQLSLALRSAEDEHIRTESDPRTLDDVLRTGEVVRKMEVYQGTQFSETRFERSSGQWHASRTRDGGPARPAAQTAERSSTPQQ